MKKFLVLGLIVAAGLASGNGHLFAQQEMKSLSFRNCSQLIYLYPPDRDFTDDTGIFSNAVWTYSSNGRGVLMIFFRNCPIKAAAFEFNNTEVIDSGGNYLTVNAHRIKYSVTYNSNTWETINPSANAVFLTDGANAGFEFYQKEAEDLFLQIKLHP